MNPTNLKKSDNYYLKQDFKIGTDKSVTFVFRAGTPIHLVSRPKEGDLNKIYRFHIVGSFAGIDVPETVFEQTIADFLEDGTRQASNDKRNG